LIKKRDNKNKVLEYKKSKKIKIEGEKISRHIMTVGRSK
jgi:hypothetical protein